MAAGPGYRWSGGSSASPAEGSGDFGDRDGRSFRNPSARRGAPAQELLCILNFTMVPNMTVLQRKLDQARADALVLTGSGDVDIRTRITSSARRCPREWYINGCPIPDSPGGNMRLSLQSGGGGPAADNDGSKDRSPAAGEKRSTSRQTSGGSGAGGSLDDPGSPAADWTRSVSHQPRRLLIDETNSHMPRFVSDGQIPNRRDNEGGGFDSFHSLVPSEESAARSARSRSSAGPSRARRLASWTRSLLPRRSAPVVPADLPADAP